MAKLLFVQNVAFEYLGPMYIAAYVADAHQCRVAVGQVVDDFDSILRSFQPDFVGFSLMSGQHSWALPLARQLKARYGVTTLFGGAHATFFPEIIEQDGVDIVCRGEGEAAVKDLLDAHAAGADTVRIANLWVKQGGIITRNDVRPLRDDIDAYPFPDRTLYAGTAAADDVVQRLITSRGCPFSCSFCFEEGMRSLYAGKGKAVRIRSVDSVIEELRRIRDLLHPRTFYFSDDVFGSDRAWLYRFLEAYRAEFRTSFVCLVRADAVCADPSYARRLREAGCQHVFFGIETGSERLRNTLLHKALTDSQITRAAALLHDAGIRFRTYNIIGLPGESVEDVYRTIALNVAIRADFPWCSLYAPYPRTSLAAYAAAHGYLPQDFTVDDLPPTFFTRSVLLLKDHAVIENLHKFFQTAVLFPWTLPLITFLSRLPPNPLYRAWFGFVHLCLYIASERRTIGQSVRIGLRTGWGMLVRG